jgi:hypothetical protein
MERNVRYLSSVIVVTSRLRLLQPENNQQISCMLTFLGISFNRNTKSLRNFCVSNSAKLLLVVEVLYKRQS